MNIKAIAIKSLVNVIINPTAACGRGLSKMGGHVVVFGQSMESNGATIDAKCKKTRSKLMEAADALTSASDIKKLMRKQSDDAALIEKLEKQMNDVRLRKMDHDAAAAKAAVKLQQFQAALAADTAAVNAVTTPPITEVQAPVVEAKVDEVQVHPATQEEKLERSSAPLIPTTGGMTGATA